MEFASLALLAAAAVGLGSAATVLLTRLVPRPVAQLAAQHGRFAGLGEQRGATAMPYRAPVQSEAMNVVRTSN
jgi:membrane protein YqaA with SNARE-associated domain